MYKCNCTRRETRKGVYDWNSTFKEVEITKSGTCVTCGHYAKWIDPNDINQHGKRRNLKKRNVQIKGTTAFLRADFSRIGYFETYQKAADKFKLKVSAIAWHINKSTADNLEDMIFMKGDVDKIPQAMIDNREGPKETTTLDHLDFSNFVETEINNFI